MTDMEIIMEDSLDGGPPSVGSGEIPAVMSTPGNSGTATPVSTKKVSGRLAGNEHDVWNISFQWLHFVFCSLCVVKNAL